VTLLDAKLKIELGFKATDIDYKIAGYRNPERLHQQPPARS
jgi:iron complex outermembrane receptor protein